MTRLLDRLNDETRPLHTEIEAEGESLLLDISVASYRRYLGRWYGFVFPVERALSDIPSLNRVHDPRRLRKHLLLSHDLQALGLKASEVDALPQCPSVPFFDDLRDAVGWSFVIERSTLDHPNLYRQLAGAIPGDVAFAASYLKCYSGSVGEMWRSFGQSIEAAAESPEDAERIIDAARAGYRQFRRWRNTLDGKTLSVVETPLQRGPTT
ncbi:MAG: biliverdin-producing heme oxygenase [Deltaproteobacteria bacterium]|nr:biliverdin-producing heme oxygenase [Deltaproteobacteria bacterium]